MRAEGKDGCKSGTETAELTREDGETLLSCKTYTLASSPEETGKETAAEELEFETGPKRTLSGEIRDEKGEDDCKRGSEMAELTREDGETLLSCKTCTLASSLEEAGKEMAVEEPEPTLAGET